MWCSHWSCNEQDLKQFHLNLFVLCWLNWFMLLFAFLCCKGGWRTKKWLSIIYEFDFILEKNQMTLDCSFIIIIIGLFLKLGCVFCVCFIGEQMQGCRSCTRPVMDLALVLPGYWYLGDEFGFLFWLLMRSTGPNCTMRPLYLVLPFRQWPRAVSAARGEDKNEINIW